MGQVRRGSALTITWQAICAAKLPRAPVLESSDFRPRPQIRDPQRPYTQVSIWGSEPDWCILNPIQKMPGLINWLCRFSTYRGAHSACICAGHCRLRGGKNGWYPVGESNPSFQVENLAS